MAEERRSVTMPQDYIEFWAAGVQAKGEFHCSECGYGVTIHRTLPVCPMCGGEAWEQSAWHPFSRSDDVPSRLP
jgi:rubrerythrin